MDILHILYIHIIYTIANNNRIYINILRRQRTNNNSNNNTISGAIDRSHLCLKLFECPRNAFLHENCHAWCSSDVAARLRWLGASS